MSLTKLKKAQAYEDKYSVSITKEERPLFHVTPTIGWMNDPNGFSYYKGEYHLFYQYHPYNTKWGPMHWGHVKSKDLLHWERLPIALAPDEEYESGCFSGTAAITADGKHLLMYTAMHQELLEDGSIKEQQTQCIAIGDGITYSKYKDNPVITGLYLPEGHSKVDFRDPKIWYDGSKWNVIIANRKEDANGCILLFQSDDTKRWEYITKLEENDGTYGNMWECPDFFSLDGSDVLLTSPMEMLDNGDDIHNGHGVIALLGSYDKGTHKFTRSHVQAIDHGFDFYAPETMRSPDNRRIMIGWMQSWEASASQLYGTKWYGMMTIPRELSIMNGKIIQNPVRELENCRKNLISYHDVCIDSTIQLENVVGRIVDMELSIRPGESGFETFSIALAKKENMQTMITYNSQNNTLCVDRSACGVHHDINNMRIINVSDRRSKIDFRFVLDRFSIEMFVNGGEQAFSMCIYETPQYANQIEFSCKGEACFDIKKYDIEL